MPRESACGLYRFTNFMFLKCFAPEPLRVVSFVGTAGFLYCINASGFLAAGFDPSKQSMKNFQILRLEVFFHKCVIVFKPSIVSSQWYLFSVNVIGSQLCCLHLPSPFSSKWRTHVFSLLHLLHHTLEASCSAECLMSHSLYQCHPLIHCWYLALMFPLSFPVFFVLSRFWLSRRRLQDDVVHVPTMPKGEQGFCLSEETK